MPLEVRFPSARFPIRRNRWERQQSCDRRGVGDQQGGWRGSKWVSTVGSRDRRNGETEERKDDAMARISRFVVVLGVGLGVGTGRLVQGEDLGQAWDIALRVNAQLQSQQAESVAAGLNLKAAQSDRLPKVR